MARPKAQQFDEINRALSSESVGQFSSAEEAPETIRQLEIAYRQAIIYAEELRGEIKDRKRAEDALERLRRQNELILNSAGEGICGLDLEGNFTFVNPAAARMIGWEPEELISRPQHEVLHHSRPDGSPYPKVGCPTCASLRDEGVHRADGGVFWKKDGTSFPVEYISAPIRGEEGQLLGAVVTFKDITERRAVERMKDEFISVVSHELRTPLTSIRGSLGLLASGMLVTLPEKAQRMADIAVNNTDRLVRLINDILDIERMDSSRATVDKRLCDAADLVAQAAEVMRDMADKAGIGLEVSAQPSELWADPDRIIQALTNLIGNAVKFSPEGATVRLTTRHRDDQVLFQVEDQGRGIPADKLDRVFERFQQVDATDSREKGGTGLGLTICRSIVDQHGGRIWAESAVGEGSTFSFILPAVRQEQPGDSPTTMAGPLVLVCDDDPSVREVMGTTLEHHGFRVLLASSGQEAVELALSRRPHVILLDLIIPRMSSANSTPRMSGWDAMAALSEGPKTRHIPIIIVSGLSAEESAAPSSSVVRWLRKPVDESALLQALKYALDLDHKSARVLVVEGDRDVAKALTAILQRHGIEAFHAQAGWEAIKLSQGLSPDLVILDPALPGGDSFAVVDWLRHHDRLCSLPLVVFSEGDLDHSNRARLTLGNTEYLNNSNYTPEELEQRVIGLVSGAVRAQVEARPHDG